MTIQFYPHELDYVNAQIRMRGPDDSSFVGAFCRACLKADADNYEILRIALGVFMRKFPMDPDLLAAEREKWAQK
jgi:hypothetical protein